MCLLDSAAIAAQIGQTGLGSALLGGPVHSDEAELPVLFQLQLEIHIVKINIQTAQIMDGEAGSQQRKANRSR